MEEWREGRREVREDERQVSRGAAEGGVAAFRRAIKSGCHVPSLLLSPLHLSF